MPLNYGKGQMRKVQDAFIIVPTFQTTPTSHLLGSSNNKLKILSYFVCEFTVKDEKSIALFMLL